MIKINLVASITKLSVSSVYERKSNLYYQKPLHFNANVEERKWWPICRRGNIDGYKSI